MTNDAAYDRAQQNANPGIPPGVKQSDLNGEQPIKPLREYLDSLDDVQRENFEREFFEKHSARIFDILAHPGDPGPEKWLTWGLRESANQFAADAQQNHRTFTRRAIDHAEPGEAEQRRDLYTGLRALRDELNLPDSFWFMGAESDPAHSVESEPLLVWFVHFFRSMKPEDVKGVRVCSPAITGLLPALNDALKGKAVTK